MHSGRLCLQGKEAEPPRIHSHAERGNEKGRERGVRKGFDLKLTPMGKAFAPTAICGDRPTLSNSKTWLNCLAKLAYLLLQLALKYLKLLIGL